MAAAATSSSKATNTTAHPFFDKTAKFLSYLPDIAVINNVEFDYADIYADMDAVTTAFARLVRLVPSSRAALIGADSPGRRTRQARRLTHADLRHSPGLFDWQAHDLEATRHRPDFVCA